MEDLQVRVGRMFDIANRNIVLQAAINVLSSDLFKDERPINEDLGIMGIRLALIFKSLRSELKSTENGVDVSETTRRNFGNLVVSCMDLLPIEGISHVEPERPSQ
jgi:hypothetical protein